MNGSKRMTATALAVGVAAVMAFPAAADNLLQTNGNVIAYTGAPVPGASDLTFDNRFDFAWMDESGKVLFRALVTGPTVTPLNDTALFVGTTSADLTMIVRSKDPAPGLAGLTLNTATQSGIAANYTYSPDGRTLWTSYLRGPGVVTHVNDSALFGGYPGSLNVIARAGDPAPGTAGAVFGSGITGWYMSNTPINWAGQLFFLSGLTGGDTTTSNNQGLFTGTAGSLSLALRKGDSLGGGSTAAAILPNAQGQMDNNGRVLYDLTLGGAATPANDRALALHTPGAGNTLVLREGDPAPGTAGATFNTPTNTWAFGLAPASFTRNGKFLVTAPILNGDVVPGVNDQVLYLGQAGAGLTLVGRTGGPAPGTDAVFSGFNYAGVHVNDAGTLAFEGILAGGTTTVANNSGMWTGAPGSLSLIARQGDPAPGTPGALLGSLNGYVMTFNDLGQVAFMNSLTGGDVAPDGSNASSLYAWTPAGGLFQVVRAGDVLQVAPGVFETVGSIGMNWISNTDGASTGLGHDGKLALSLNFMSHNWGIVTVDLNCYPPSIAYRDADGDGFGTPDLSTYVCHGAATPAGYVTDNTDCNDANPGAHPEATEVCNAIDDNCDTLIDEGFDLDGDGYTTCNGDCNDANPAIHPGARDTNCNGIDENCSGVADEGYVTQNTTCGVGACRSTGTRTCVNGQVVNSCVPGTPAPDDASCDGIDDNCNGVTDEGYVSQPSTCGLGACANTGQTSCVGGSVISNCVPGAPAPESCNGLDDDCNGVVDNVAAPTGTSSLTVAQVAGETMLSWGASSAATGYDAVAGDLQELRGNAGNYGSLALASCLGNDVAATTLSAGSGTPAPGAAEWYLVRAGNCGGNGTYDDGGPRLSAPRDAGIQAGGYACP